MYSKTIDSPVIYEIFPRNHGINHNFSDILADLDRIQSLGVDIIWLMPHYPIGQLNRKGKEGSPYAIQDFRNVHPQLGTLADFKLLADRIHEAEMKLMVDIVYNHTACDSILSKEHPDWFLKDVHGNFTRKEPEWSDVIDLDYRNHDLWEYQIDTLAFWLDQGVDGFRCDVASVVPLEFWEECKRRLNKTRSVIWLAESVRKSYVRHLRRKEYRCSSDPELHPVFDISYDYDGFEYLEQYFRGSAPITDYLNHLFVQETLYPAGSQKLRFIENHDQPRISSRFQDIHLAFNWSVFYNLLPGASLIYAGQEMGANHLPNLFEIDEVDWSGLSDPFVRRFSKMIKLCKQICQSSLYFSIKEIYPSLIEIKWDGSHNRYIALLQLETDPLSGFQASYSGINLLTMKEFDLNIGSNTFEFPIIIENPE